MVPPAIFILILWLIGFIQSGIDLDLYYLGIYPRKISGLAGILLSPVIHANFHHLINNSVPLFFMLTAVFYFYYTVAWRVFFYSYFITGVLVWIIARPSYHIGASGLIYSFGAFLFFSGIIRGNINLLAISLLVSFLYGSMVWGIFPYRPDMSWESHLTGMTIGSVLAVYFKHEGPEPTRFIRDLEDEDEWTEELDEEEPG